MLFYFLRKLHNENLILSFLFVNFRYNIICTETYNLLRIVSRCRLKCTRKSEVYLNDLGNPSPEKFRILLNVCKLNKHYCMP